MSQGAAPEDLSYGERDLVLCLDVLEHLVDPVGVLKRVTSTMPDSRMNSQEYISKLLRRPDTRFRGARGASMPRVMAKRTAWARSSSPSLANRWLMCVLTVASLT